jgi:hypothetical protein
VREKKGKHSFMARPKKEKELKRNRRITLRFTDVEYEVITENAKAAKLPLAEYARLQALGRKVSIKYEIVADAPELKKLIAEFGKTSSNLNQIARHLNQGRQQTAEILKTLRQRLAEIYEMKYAVIKMAGSFSTAGQYTDNSKGASHGSTETHSS